MILEMFRWGNSNMLKFSKFRWLYFGWFKSEDFDNYWIHSLIIFRNHQDLIYNILKRTYFLSKRIWCLGSESLVPYLLHSRATPLLGLVRRQRLIYDIFSFHIVVNILLTLSPLSSLPHSSLLAHTNGVNYPLSVAESF